MKELPDFVASELSLMKIPVSRIARLLCVSSWDEDQTTAFGTYVQNVYTGVERVLQYLLREKGENIPKPKISGSYQRFRHNASTSFIPFLPSSRLVPAYHPLMPA
jgi:hypothetical protein